MKKYLPSSLLLIGTVVAAAVAAPPRWTPPTEAKPQGRARVCLYHVAPGRHLDFLKWQAAQDEVAKEAGVPVPQVYAHMDGDSWDYLLLSPVTTPEQDKKLDEIAKGKGLKVGMSASLEFRALVASHTDTLAAGPLTAKELVAMAQE
jgi:hypothetical protein